MSEPYHLQGHERVDTNTICELNSETPSSTLLRVMRNASKDVAHIFKASMYPLRRRLYLLRQEFNGVIGAASRAPVEVEDVVEAL